MAYMNKELKAKIVAEIKKVLPKDWKATYKVENLSTIIVTIRKAPVVLKDVFENAREDESFPYNVNMHNVKTVCKDEKVAETVQKIVDAMEMFNHNNSDSMTDYFDIGYYTTLQFGSWDKPFESTK